MAEHDLCVLRDLVTEEHWQVTNDQESPLEQMTKFKERTKKMKDAIRSKWGALVGTPQHNTVGYQYEAFFNLERVIDLQIKTFELSQVKEGALTGLYIAIAINQWKMAQDMGKAVISLCMPELLRR